AISASSPSIAAGNVSVSPITGAAGAAIGLPASNPNVPGLTFVYSSTGANATPIIDGNFALSAARAQVSARLTFNGTVGSTYYYDTSAFRPGDILQIGQQANAASLTTNRYAYTLAVTEVGGSTTSLTGTATLINEATDPTFAAFGKGWTLAGLN
ncbi:hypothetical protein, partial [Aquisphaera insulae]|uniref:hypothetical protein n=1 Tax=Aquisphaera insulae TaxID=2712864 RepID=UPI0013EC38F8